MKLEAQFYENFDSFLQLNGALQKEFFVLAAEQTPFCLEALHNATAQITGAFFPEIIFNNRLHKEGLIALEITSNIQLFLIKDMNNLDFSHIPLKQTPTVLTIVDGICNQNEHFLNQLFQYSGLQTNIFGAGAGSLDAHNQKVFFTNEGLLKCCAVLLTLENRMDLGVKHGWQYLEGPFVVTSCEGNTLKELDFKNAYDVYKEIVYKDSGITLDETNFLEVSKNYPLGVVKYQGEQLVRDPIGVENGVITLVGQMSQNTVINVLKGDKQTLLNATKEASFDALKNECEFILMFDCLTRKNFLEEKFEEELDIIFSQKKSLNVMGAISIGEVANDGKDYIKFFNKTCVIGGICF